MEEIRQWALQQTQSGSVGKFVAELAWRAFFHLVHEEEGDRILKDMEHSKVPLNQHQKTLPEDIAAGENGFTFDGYFYIYVEGDGLST